MHWLEENMSRWYWQKMILTDRKTVKYTKKKGFNKASVFFFTRHGTKSKSYHTWTWCAILTVPAPPAGWASCSRSAHAPPAPPRKAAAWGGPRISRATPAPPVPLGQWRMMWGSRHSRGSDVVHIYFKCYDSRNMTIRES